MTNDESLLRRFLSPTTSMDYRVVYGTWALFAVALAFGIDGFSTFPLLPLSGLLCALVGAWIGKLVGISVHAGAAFTTLVWFLFSQRILNI